MASHAAASLIRCKAYSLTGPNGQIRVMNIVTLTREREAVASPPTNWTKLSVLIARAALILTAIAALAKYLK